MEPEKSPVLPLLAGLVALSAAAVAAVFYWTSDDSPDPASVPSAETPANPFVSGSPNAGLAAENGRPATASGRDPAAVPSSPFVEKPAVTTQSAPPEPRSEPGESATDQVLAVAESSAPKPEKVRELKKFLRQQYDEDTQRLAIRNLRKIIKDEEYEELMSDELMNPDQPEFVRNALIVDMESRNRNYMIPVMADLATGPEHPLKEHATNYLQANLGDSYSSDPKELEKAIKTFIDRKIDGF